MNRQTVLLLAMVLLSVPVHGAAVLWNSPHSFGGGMQSDTLSNWSLVFHSAGDDWWMYALLDIHVEQGTTPVNRLLYAYDQDVGNGARWILAQEGDVIDSNAAADAAKRFSSNYAGEEQGLSTVSYRRNEIKTVYLGIELEIARINSSSVAEMAYGWVELFADNYTLTLGRSCIDLSGRPVVVGVRSVESVPEPATHALALLGTLLLFPRRRRMDILKYGKT